jgi:hypothetical protein
LPGQDDSELARLLADADTIGLLKSSGRVERARDVAARRVRDAFAALPGEFGEEVVSRAARAVAAEAGLRCMVRALCAPAHTDATARHADTIRSARISGRPSAPQNAFALPEVASSAIAAALARAAVADLDRRLSRLRPTADVIAGQLREDRVHAGPRRLPGAARDRTQVERRLADAARARRDRIARLVVRLLAETRSAGPPALDLRPPDDECLQWLLGILNDGLYSPGDELHGRHWLGGDPFGLREAPRPPQFMTDVDYSALRPEHVAPLLRRISLTRDAPQAADLTPAALDRDRGLLSQAPRSPRHRRWGRADDSAAPSLPPVTRIPRMVHSIWLGTPPKHDSDVLDNIRFAARRYAGEVDFVLWTDVPRAAFDENAEGFDQVLGRKARGLLEWARDNGVLLVSIFEVFHRDAPMACQAQFALETSKLLPRGYAAASDILRIEIVERFGGCYADADLRLRERYAQPGQSPASETLPRFMDRIAASRLGFTMDPMAHWRHAVNNDVIVAEAHHPAIRLWLEQTRINYLVPQRDIVGGMEAMSHRFVGMEPYAMRYLAPYRTGRMHHRVLARLGLGADDLPPTQPPFLFWSSCSWIPPREGEPVRIPDGAPDAGGPDAGGPDAGGPDAGGPDPRHAGGGEPPGADEDEVIRVLKHCATFLDWQLRAREGDLYLAALDPVVRGLPDPAAAWAALLFVLFFLPAHGHAGAARTPSVGGTVTSVTTVRRGDDGSRVERVGLPPEALAMIDREGAAAGWLGAPLSPEGECVWLLDERVEPARLRDPRLPGPGLGAIAAPHAAVALDLLGRPIGLWLGPSSGAQDRRGAYSFATLPEGHFGLKLAGPDDWWTWVDEPALCPEAVARLLLGVGAAGRPVLLSAPRGTLAAAQRFATELAGLLGKPVEAIEGPLRSRERREGGIFVPTTWLAYRDWAGHASEDRLRPASAQAA